jgi:methylenetetrahydrofolate reductase (NADPH)
MNLAQSSRMILEELDLMPAATDVEKPLPWRQSLGHNRREENVRPIFWRNRNRSYIERTSEWDEFPNGRWGDSRSPAFGELDAYGIGLKGTNDSNIKLWGEPKNIKDVANLFVGYMRGKVESLPWSESPISSEANVLTEGLVDLNTRGLLTINSQPPVNGVKSSHAVYGWGPRNGFVYQKAYLEVLVSPELISEVITRIERDEDFTYFAVNKNGDLKTNAPSDGPNAVTWGVFPGKEIVQPTIVETISFLAWKDEFYRLGGDWANCYAEATPSRHLISTIMDTWYLVNIVHNDFHVNNGIFPLFEGLSVPDAEKPFLASTNGHTNGHTNGASTNGNAAAVNGHANGHTSPKAEDTSSDGTKPAAESTTWLPTDNKVEST